jgi:hypothetical protein
LYLYVLYAQKESNLYILIFFHMYMYTQVFFHMVPSLKEKPPYFDPKLTDAQWLPDMGMNIHLYENM